MCPARLFEIDYNVHVYIRFVADEFETYSTVFSINRVLCNCNFVTKKAYTTYSQYPVRQNYGYLNAVKDKRLASIGFGDLSPD
jgi:hypothetical protein